MKDNNIEEIIEGIIENADELLEKGRENLNQIEQGQLIAYAESLSIIQDAFSGMDLKNYGLDFDVDKKYLG